MNNFDPLLFLGIKNISEDKKDEVASTLMCQINRYLITRFLELLPEEEVQEYDDPNIILFSLQSKFPDYQEKTKIFLEDFRQDFKKRIGK